MDTTVKSTSEAAVGSTSDTSAGGKSQETGSRVTHQEQWLSVIQGALREYIDFGGQVSVHSLNSENSEVTENTVVIVLPGVKVVEGQIVLGS